MVVWIFDIMVNFLVIFYCNMEIFWFNFDYDIGKVIDKKKMKLIEDLEYLLMCEI